MIACLHVPSNRLVIISVCIKITKLVMAHAAAKEKMSNKIANGFTVDK